MIGYPISREELRKRIGAKWLAKAAAATAALQAGQKVEKAIWSEAKPVYMDLQNGKCAFCESLLGKQIDFDLIKQDVEHFRPKNGVDSWPSDKLRDKLKLPSDLPGSRHQADGYTFLAYHELNYASSCKTCNSTLKANYFPTIKEPNPKGNDPKALTESEQPYLINPVGDYDTKPEDIITFLGLLPIPARPASEKISHDRARVTIAFFGLSIRDDLMYGRALLLDQIGDKFRLRAAATDDEKVEIDGEIDNLCLPITPHSNCCTAFTRLFRTKPAKGLEMLAIIKAYLKSFGATPAKG